MILIMYHVECTAVLHDIPVSVVQRKEHAYMRLGRVSIGYMGIA